MEDKFRHSDHPAFTDHAWAEMKKLLDEEMPAAEKRRRPVAWWWFFAAALLLGGVALYGFMAFGKKTKPAANQAPVAVTEEKSAGQENEAALFEKEENGDAKPEPQIFEKTENTPPKILSGQTGEQENVPQNTDNHFFTNKENTLPLFHFAPAKTAAADLPELPAAEIGVVKKETPEPTLPQVSLMEKIGELPLSAFPVADAAPSIGAECPPRRRFGLSAYATTFFTQKNSGGGIGAGLLAHFPVKQSRFQIHTGLGYAYLTQPLDVVAVPLAFDGEDPTEPNPVSDLEYSDFYVLFNGSNNLDFKGQETSDPVANFELDDYDDLLHLHYVQVPLEVSYRRGRWQLFGGAQAGLLFTSKSELLSGGLFSSDDRNQDGPGGFNSGANASSNFESKIKSFDLAATAGIGFDLSPRLGLGLNYRHGLVDVVSRNLDNKDFNRFFQATVRYRIR